MALQTSGPISIGNLQTVYGGANPASMSEYYRKTDNSGLVKYSKVITENPSYVYPDTSWAWADPAYLTIKLSGAIVYSTTSAGGSGITSVTAGGWTYNRGTYMGEASANFFYSYSRNQTVLLNELVPTSLSGLSLSKYYGGTN